jgi:hypothetical protein
VAVSGSTTFFDGAAQVAAGSGGTTTLDGLTNAVAFMPPDNTAIAFDSLTSNFTITALGAPGTLEEAVISYQLFSAAVPEPAAWALMVVGLGGLGAALRRRRAAPNARSPIMAG